MTPIKQGKYQYNHGSLVDVRKRLGKTQAQMAKLLEIPPNTLARWERGDTTPDAKHLAAFYSLAKEYNITAVFFAPLGEVNKPEYELIVIWDFQTAGISPTWVRYEHDRIIEEMSKRFSGMTVKFKAFAHPDQAAASDELLNLKWDVWEDDSDKARDDIIHHAKSDCGHNPEGTALVLISGDDFTELVDYLKQKGVQVFLMKPGFQSSTYLEPGQSIQWYPTALDSSKRQLKTSSVLPFGLGNM